MAVVLYRCDVCKREKEYVRIIDGIENINRCTITHGCRGSLYQIDLMSDFTQAGVSTPVFGLDEWLPRRVLYDHTQVIARSTWTIPHNLGTTPAISVFVNIPTETDINNMVEISPTDVIIVDSNNIMLVFDRQWSGVAQLVARQSPPDILSSTTIESASIRSRRQISIGGEITIATRVPTIGTCANVGIMVSFTTATGNTEQHLYSNVSESLLNSVSPWSDFDSVVIKGKIYTVRSYQGIYQSIQDDIVGNGSTFTYDTITECSGSPPNTRSIEKNEVLLLMSNPPFATVDKDTGIYVDVTDITPTMNQFALVYDNGEFFIDEAAIKTIYPAIRNI